MAGNLPSLSNLTSSELELAKEFSYGIVVSLWNPTITDQLVQAALETLQSCQVPSSAIYLERVPGSFELPLAAQWLLNTKMPDALICLGCIIKGETQHDEFIAHAITDGIMQLNLRFDKPVILGVLTVNSMQQANERAGGILGNKGTESILAAIKMLSLQRSLNTAVQSKKT